LKAEDVKDSLRTCVAVRLSSAPKVDGKLDDAVWNSANLYSDFIQNRPIEGTQPTYPTEVKIAYTDYAVYVYAKLKDEHPDSILHQLGKRDDNGLNGDYFYFKIDPYDNRQDAYQFGVYASGIQMDSKFSDGTYNGVWKSAVSIDKEGWNIEMEIPFSAIRFPQTEDQHWAFQFVRSVRRIRETDQFSLTPSTSASPLMYWARLNGINHINTPVRLSMTPYAAISYEKSPEYDDIGDYRYSNSYSYSLGADIKYGIDDRFTLDMTLLPDFGQVQTDKKVKNLGYNEIVYDENRSFFQEGVDLFNKGNLFYSRRIGRVPTGYYSVYDKLEEGETVIENPAQAKLLNATKISGRTNKGLGIGFFNAITDNMYATVESTSGEKRKIETEPFTNYNIVVLDQQFKNNSDLYLINASTIRRKGYADANVTGAGFTLSNYKSTYSFSGEGAITYAMYVRNENISYNKKTFGYNYSLELKKLSGNFKYSIKKEVIDTNFNNGDIGYFTVNGKKKHTAQIDYYLFQPKGIFRDAILSFGYYSNNDFKTLRIGENEISISGFSNLLNYHSILIGFGITPTRDYNYYEARTEGRVFHGLRYYYSYLGFSTDYRKKIAIDYNFNWSNFLDKFRHEGYNQSLSLRIRPFDKLFIIPSFQYNYDPFNVGYAADDDNGDIIFGGRRLDTYNSELKLSYTFNDKANLTVTGRHYWITGHYKKYFTLLEDGELALNETYNVNNNFNQNYFNIDVVYEWRFSPGSVVNIIYKNGIDSYSQDIRSKYDQNFGHLLNAPQTNMFSIKFLYYLDYQMLRHKSNG
jgi:hypothetical protein